MDKAAPLPPLRNQMPAWNRAAKLAHEWDLNWQEVATQQDDGSQEMVRQYVSPEAERQHFAAFETDLRK